MSALAAALAAIVLNHAVFAAAAFPIWLWAAWIAFAAACLARGDLVLRPEGELGRPTRAAWALGALAFVPVALPLAASGAREFGFGGDSSFHIGTAFRLALWWASPPFSTPSAAFDPAALDALRAAPWNLAIARATMLALGVAAFLWARRSHPRAA